MEPHDVEPHDSHSVQDSHSVDPHESQLVVEPQEPHEFELLPFPEWLPFPELQLDPELDFSDPE
ncbi:hypothetical protein [Klugiella xanthotipulae]|uniref:hypothetical protein n=1 Tax=Klugiella xanthotipulae TaxID=244735 RepID=UPI00114EB127|nr:hypothetical protein [Klugiella xanthotipulae]